jgi:NAD(P)-dependent dehydrogenase (short-subunit alcohol dehydrogenase family)
MGSSMGYSVTKAAGLQLMKLVASGNGLKLRINAILPGLLLTEWVSYYLPVVCNFLMGVDFEGQDFGPAIIDHLKKRSILKHEVFNAPGTFSSPSNYDSGSDKIVQTYIDDCAKVFVDLAQNTSITGQQIIVGQLL